ncbi:Uncharacterised protein [Escherichia coli]|nr:Uncharacterised protein [Escherichia coli]
MGTVTFDCRMFVSLYPEFSTGDTGATDGGV